MDKPQREQTFSQIQKLISEYVDDKFPKLQASEELNSYSEKAQILEYADFIRAKLDIIQNYESLKWIDGDGLNTLHSKIRTCNSTAHSIAQKVPEGGPNMTEEDQRYRRAERFLGAAIELGMTLNDLLAAFKGLSADEVDLSKLISKSKEAYEEIERKRVEANSAISKLGVEIHTKDYANIQKEFRKASNWWLGFTVASGISLVGFGFFLLQEGFSEEELNALAGNGYLLFAQLSGRLIILSGLIFLSSLCSRNYKNYRHNHLVAKYKATALSTFKTFVEGSDSPQIKDAVLLEATRAIFSSTSTGFSNSPDDGENSHQRIIEIIKDMGRGPQ